MEFCANFIRLFVTEILTYGALMTALYKLNSPSFPTVRLTMLILLGILYFLTAVVMKVFVVIKLTYSLLRACRVTNNFNTFTVHKHLLCFLCINTFVLIILQAILVVFAGGVSNDDNGGILLFMIGSGLVPPLLWWLYFLYTSPWGRFFPLSVALHLPPVANSPTTIDVHSLSPLFKRMYDDATTRNGLIVNMLRLYTSPPFICGNLVFLAAWLCIIIGYANIYPSYFVLSYGVFVLVLLIGLSFPSVVFGLPIIMLTPFSFCMLPILKL